MAELLETRDLTDPNQHGWAVDYFIQRADGEHLHVEVRCWDRAHEAAKNSVNAASLDAIDNRGLRAASTQPRRRNHPLPRAVMISIGSTCR